MTERIRLALDSHADDPAGAAQALRALIGEDLTQFVRASALLRNERDKAEFLPVVEVLAQTEGISECLSDPQLLDKDSAVDLAHRIAEIAPALDGKLVRLLPGRGFRQFGSGEDACRLNASSNCWTRLRTRGGLRQCSRT